MRETWRDYIARLKRVYRVTLDECHREGMTEDGHRIVTRMLVRDLDGLLLPCFVPVDDLDDYVRPRHYEMVSEALRIPDDHAKQGFD